MHVFAPPRLPRRGRLSDRRADAGRLRNLVQGAGSHVVDVAVDGDVGGDQRVLAYALQTVMGLATTASVLGIGRLVFTPRIALGGALVRLQPVGGFSLPRASGSCPLWPLYQALSRPMVPVRAVLAQAPLFQPETPRGQKMSVRMSACGTFGWVSDRRGYRYERRHPSGVPWPPIPSLSSVMR